jgi:hypothetical protein
MLKNRIYKSIDGINLIIVVVIIISFTTGGGA